MNWKTISRNVGYALLVSALFMLISLVIAIVGREDTVISPLSISFLLTFIFGVFPFIFVRKTAAITMREGYVIIVLSWLLSFIFGMLPYVLWGGPFSVINAWFESVSGFTTTGASILEEVESLPKALLFWRASTHFIGGLGVVVFLLLIIPSSSPMRLRLTNMELSSLSKDSYNVRANQTVYIFTSVYLGLNIAAFVAYMIAGMTPFDSICHSFSVCATGGFSSRNLSIASFNSLPITLVTMFFMYVSSLHFGMLYITIVTRSLKPLNNDVFKFFTGILVAGSIIVATVLKADGVVETWPKAFLDGSFQLLSYTSTTGFAICDNSNWPLFPALMIMVFGIQCGMAGSTTGGVKSDRILLTFKSLAVHLRRSINPSTVNEVRLNGKPVSDKDVDTHVLYVAIFFIVFALSTLLCLASGSDNANAIMGTLCCLDNVGPAAGSTIGSLGNYNAEPSMAKFFYTVDMFMGRVELYPVLAVASFLFTRRNR
ncbi:MAG: TrkH family potassium uptake protein [Bacteroidales bacterium]|nr:TrkH family potassium uptake protein [Bacteroidales bacterium]